MKKRTAGTGIGIDMERVDRFGKFAYDTRDTFLRRVFTKKELGYCFSKRKPAEHLAARYAAKEAVVKALGSSRKTRPRIAYNRIEVAHTKSGAPRVVIHNKRYADVAVQISLSHTRELAVAIALII